MNRHELMKKAIVDSIIGMPEESFIHTTTYTTRDGTKKQLSATFHRDDFDTIITEKDIAEIAETLTVNGFYYCIPMRGMIEEAIDSHNSLTRFGVQPQYYSQDEMKDMADDLAQRLAQRLRRYSKGHGISVREFSDLRYGFRFN